MLDQAQKSRRAAQSDRGTRPKTKKAPPATRRRQRYSSHSISERRRRILAETMNLIDEKGVDGFTILELSARAEVAQKTLYNAYGDKQTIIANAIDHSMRHLGETFPPIAAGDIDGILLQLDKMCVRFLKRPKLVRATSLLYFSHSLDPRVHASLRSMALRYLSPCLRLYEQRGQLLPWVPIGIIENQFANLAHSIDHDWATGRISDQDFPTAINFALLSTLAAVVKDPLRARLCAPLARLSAALSRRGLVSKAAKQKTRPARRTRQR